MKKLLTVFFMLLVILTGCVNREPTIYCVPLSQWQALTPDQQKQAVAWFNQHAFVSPQNLPYTAAIGDAQFGPPGSVPRQGPAYYECRRNLYYEANINVDAYPFKAP